jgi:hypothetical protein
VDERHKALSGKANQGPGSAHSPAHPNLTSLPTPHDKHPDFPTSPRKVNWRAFAYHRQQEPIQSIFPARPDSTALPFARPIPFGKLKFAVCPWRQPFSPRRGFVRDPRSPTRLASASPTRIP